MDVSEFFKEQNQMFRSDEKLSLSGWLTLINQQLVLLPDQYGQDYLTAPRITLSQPEIAFALLHQVALLGGGDCFLFHQTKIECLLKSLSPPTVEVLDLQIEAEMRNKYKQANINQEMIEKGKMMNPNLLLPNDNPSRDWLDYA
jgi:hypothetical protein